MNTVDVFLRKQELNKFLNENPHLKETQLKIDALLKAAGSSHNRMALLANLMNNRMTELHKLNTDLAGLLTKLHDIAKR